ncbi:MAG: YdcF family protein [Blautia sp.]|nr:YdcF family protein [Blautia sp.]MDY3998433.1 YdcF family protein [Blautia sp.]
MPVVCIVLSIICLIYYLVLILYAGITVDFAWIWLLAAVFSGGGGALISYGRNHPGFFPDWIHYVVFVVLAVGCAIFLGLCTQIIRGMTWNGSRNLDYVVVLGAQVKGTVPSRALNKRLKKALEYAEQNEYTILILSGGRGSGEEITEAECMRQYLVSHGIKEERLILEDRSTNTKENLEFSDRLTGCADARTGVLSNNFHVYRAVKLAEKLNYRYAEGIAAPSDPLMQVHYVVREVFALVKEKIKGHI